MTRNRSTSRPGSSSLLQPTGYPRKGSRPLLLFVLLLALGGSPAAWAQAAAENVATKPRADSTATSMATSTTVATAPATSWNTVWAVLGGVVIGAFGAWLWARRMAKPEGAARPLADVAPEIPVEPARKMPAQNVWKSSESRAATPGAAGPSAPSQVPGPAAAAPTDGPARNITAQPLREVQGVPKPTGKSLAGNKKSKSNSNSRSSAAKSHQAWPQVPHRPSAMNPTTPTVPPADEDKPLEHGQTIEWAAPTSTPPAIQELIEASAPPAAAAAEAGPAAAAPSNGPVHYYAPAPDVPSIEHRKLSPNPLPQMPMLVTLAHVEATTAQFSFSPQADQSRIIGNGVRELKEFFQFELPPTEQFTTIKNLTPGKLEKRDDAWHVVQKAEIALR